MKRIIGLLFFSFLLTFAHAQNEPIYSQYMFNPLIINPAYAGVHDMASVYGVYRNQWTGFGGQKPFEKQRYFEQLPKKTQEYKGFLRKPK